jgi:hypothetical protein
MYVISFIKDTINLVKKFCKLCYILRNNIQQVQLHIRHVPYWKPQGFNFANKELLAIQFLQAKILKMKVYYNYPHQQMHNYLFIKHTPRLHVST